MTPHVLLLAGWSAEHIVAKKVDPKLAYQWDNLTIACDRCNTNKSNKSGVLDPYEDDLSSALNFSGPWIHASFGNDEGKLTIVVLKLNRVELIERRSEKLDSFRAHLENIYHTRDPRIRRTLLDALLTDACQPPAEFSACVSSHAKDLKRTGQL